MKIISNFRDYYDGAAFYSDDVQYIRKEKVISLKLPEPVKKTFDKGYYYNHHLSTFKWVSAVGFCGEWFIHFTVDNGCGEVQREFFHTNVDLSCLKKIDKRYYSFDPKKVIDVFAESAETFKQHCAHFFIESESPYLNIDLNSTRYSELGSRNNQVAFRVNFNSLGKLGFQKVYDPYTAAMKIESFLSNELVRRDNPHQITDSVVLLESKGFDKKTSFRHPIK